MCDFRSRLLGPSTFSWKPLNTEIYYSAVARRLAASALESVLKPLLISSTIC